MISRNILTIATISLIGLLPALSSAQADQAMEKSDEMRTQAKNAAAEMSTRHEGMSKEEHAETVDEARSKADATEEDGNDRPQRMRDRRDQRKAIMDAEKSKGMSNHDDSKSDGKTKEKKPWWKFWGD